MDKEIKNDITLIGETDYRDKRTKFGIKTDDRRRHVYVIGKTGVGKTTLLENMAISDIEANHGMCFVDPHGESSENLLDYIPENRLEDVIYFDPSDTEQPIGFNPLEQVADEQRHLVASGMMGVFKKIWPDVWSTRMEYILNNTLLALLEYPNATLLGVLRMFSDKQYRKDIVENLQDPVVKHFWKEEFAKYSQQFQVQTVAAIQNKVGQFVTNPLVRNILGQSKSAIDMKKVMDEGKILIVNLSKGKIGEDNMALIGAMVITKLQLTAMARAKESNKDFRDFFLYVDEFQNFATESFATILSEARKYRLSLVLAHQYINQLISDGNTKVRDAIFGNVGTIISFRVGAADAEFLEKEFEPAYNANDLVNLSKFHIYIRLMIDGMASNPFSAATLPPKDPSLDASPKETIIEFTRRKYGTPRMYVEKKISEEWILSSDKKSESNKNSFSKKEKSLKEVLGNEIEAEKKIKNKPKKKSKKVDVNINELKGVIEEALGETLEEEGKKKEQ